VLVKKVKHGLHNHRLGYFIVARLLWAAGYAQAVMWQIKTIISR